MQRGASYISHRLYFRHFFTFFGKNGFRSFLTNGRTDFRPDFANFRNFSGPYDGTESTKLCPVFDIVDVTRTPIAVYRNDEVEIEDTASSSVKLVGEVVAESSYPSLSLTPDAGLTVEDLSTASNAAQMQSDVYSDRASGVTNISQAPPPQPRAF